MGLIDGVDGRWNRPSEIINEHTERSGQSSLTYLGAPAPLQLLLIVSQGSLFSDAKTEPMMVVDEWNVQAR